LRHFSEVCLVELKNQPGELARICEQLGAEHINIEYAYLATSPKSQQGLLILRPSNVEKAARALRDL
jgi:hypothetical protein